MPTPHTPNPDREAQAMSDIDPLDPDQQPEPDEPAGDDNEEDETVVPT